MAILGERPGEHFVCSPWKVHASESEVQTAKSVAFWTTASTLAFGRLAPVIVVE